jgi:tetratricopeptide (TPR) repeat protein
MRHWLLLVLLLISVQVAGQSELLAKNYLDKGAYDKALNTYEKLLKQNPGRLDYFLYVVKCHQQLEQFEKATELLDQKLKNPRVIPQLYVELGHNYALQQQDSLANVAYNQAVDFALEKTVYSYSVGKALEEYSLLDQAASLYEQVMKQDPNRNFSAQLARIYGEQGKLEKMFDAYLDLMMQNPSYQAIAKRNFSMYVSEDDQSEGNQALRKVLLRRLQSDPDILYNELLSWLFVQQGQFDRAFVQEKAIYKRTEEELYGLIDLALIAIEAKDYENAGEIVDFIIEKAPTPQARLQGEQYRMKILLATADKKDFPEVEKSFQELIEAYGNGPQTYVLQIDYNHFLAFQAGKVELAIEQLKALSKQALSPAQEARVKMELADILVFDQKFNQALIYYSQVQRKLENDPIAQEARFKVARTSYYKGDFKWAQTQLDVLKKSASQLIANDAMHLSLVISDNTLDDSTQTALKKFARADLLKLQKKYSEALTVLDDVLTAHKGEKIEDEALLLQGDIYQLTGQFERAAKSYEKLIELYGQDILADDAHYKLARLYEEQLAAPEKARQLYEQIVYNYADSIYFVDARRRFRKLRGDAIN